MHFWSNVPRFNRMNASVARLDDPQSAGDHILARGATSVFAEIAVAFMPDEDVGCDVLGHEESIASTGDTTSDLRDFTQGYEPVAEPSHDVKVDIGRANKSSPFAGTVGR